MDWKSESDQRGAMSEESRRGLFVVFEGGDAVGKSTQVALLVEELRRVGHDVVHTHQPGDTEAGRLIRSIVLDPATGDLSPKAEALLYAADKAHHVHAVVRPALDRGAVVVCDRYVDSMLAYQGAGRVLELEQVERIARWATDELRPDLTVLLDSDPAEAVARLVERDRLEAAGAEFHTRVRLGFIELAKRDPERYLLLGARQERAEIAAQILARVGQLLDDQVRHDDV